MLYEEKIIGTVPVGPLGLAPLKSCTELDDKVNAYLMDWRRERESEHKSTIAFSGHQRDSYITNAVTPRSDTGEDRGPVTESVRGDDSYVMVDIYNYSLTYSLSGITSHMPSDDHFQDSKHVITAAVGKVRGTNMIMSFLCESRQHRRSGKKSLDYVLTPKELVSMRVENTITFDAYDPRVQNAIPLQGFETVQPIYQFSKYLLKNEADLQIDSNHMMVISPDEGGTGRAVYSTNIPGLGMGMFCGHRDHTRTVGSRDPVVAHEFLGTSVKGKDVLIIDGMISSGESVMDVTKELKHRKARKAFVCATFGLFTGGLTRFGECYDKGAIGRILTANLVYQTPSLLERPYYIDMDMSKYITLIINNPNHGTPLSDLLTPIRQINWLSTQYHSQWEHNVKNRRSSSQIYLPERVTALKTGHGVAFLDL